MSTTRKPSVSVVVPMYNVEGTLDQCLESIESQTLRDLQIICMNDGSTDRSGTIARRHAARDPRITVVDKPNEGYGATCNKGIALADGEWVAIVEPDDYLDPTMYEKLYAAACAVNDENASTEPQVDVVKCAYWRVLPNAKKPASCPYVGRVKPRTQPFAVGDGIELMLHHPAIWAAMYRRGFLAERGIRFREVPGSGWTDNPFMVQTLCGARGLAYVDEPLYYYREHDLNDAEALAAKSPLIPLTRWNEMMDEVDKLGIADERVLDALALRGVNYALITSSAFEKTALPQDVRELIDCSMARIDPARVWGLAALSPSAKSFFAQARGIEAPKNDALARAGYLAKEAAYRLRTNGLGFVAENLKSRLNRL